MFNLLILLSLSFLQLPIPLFQLYELKIGLLYLIPISLSITLGLKNIKSTITCCFRMWTILTFILRCKFMHVGTWFWLVWLTRFCRFCLVTRLFFVSQLTTRCILTLVLVCTVKFAAYFGVYVRIRLHTVDIDIVEFLLLKNCGRIDPFPLVFAPSKPIDTPIEIWRVVMCEFSPRAS